MLRAVVRLGASVGLWVLAVAGCEPQPGAARVGLRLAPATLGTSISLQQRLRVEQEGRIDEIDAALEVDSERIDLIGLALGRRIFTLHYDGSQLRSWRHPTLPIQLRGEDVLEDILLTLWPVEAIRPALPNGWRIQESGRRRTLFLDGVPVTVIDYTSEPRWSGEIHLVNLRYRYRLTIQSAPNAS